MNLSGGLIRKLIYAAVIALLLLPLYRLGQPLTNEGGGALARLRTDYGLAEANLGEIDPASNSMRLATLGMRGVAATLLWKKSDDYKKLQEWDRLSATLDVIALLQPHFEKVWEHQAHNLSYNISVEFDDYHQRYNWVKKGTEFLMRGVRRNRRAPRLEWYTGWFFGQKIGIADEKRQFRKLFSDDKEYHKVISEQGINIESSEAKGPYQNPDNWLVGRLWLKHAYDLVDNEHVPLLRKNPLHFYQDASLWRTHHGVAIEEEGVLDQRAAQAWRQATEDWIAYGARDIPTYDGYSIRLGDLEKFRADSSELSQKFSAMTEGLDAKLRTEKLAALSDEEEASLDTPIPDRTQKQALLAAKADSKLVVLREDIIRALPEEQQLAAMQLLTELAVVETKTNKINGYRNQTNFDYWYTRTLAEQEDQTLKARQLIFEAEQALDKADLTTAIAKYEEAFTIWRDILDRYPIMVTDASSDDLAASVGRYLRILDIDQFPDDFPLKVFIEMKGVDSGTRISHEAYVKNRRDEKSSQKTAVDAPKEEPKTPEDTPKEALKDEPKDTPKDEPKDTPKDEPKDTPKDEPKDTPKDEPKDEPKDTPKDEPKDTPEDEPREEPKGLPKDEPKEEPKVES